MEYEERNIKTENPTADELKEWIPKSDYPVNKFFNTSGKLYKDMKLKDKLPEMSDNEKIELLSTDGMLVKRPVIVSDGSVLVGFKESEWKDKMVL